MKTSTGHFIYSTEVKTWKSPDAVCHPANRIPIEYLDVFRKENPGKNIRFRGTRLGTHHTRKENATHFSANHSL